MPTSYAISRLTEDRAIQRVMAAVGAALTEIADDHVAQLANDDLFVHSAESILHETLDILRRGARVDPELIDIDHASPAELDRIGRLNAEQNWHPADALFAAEFLFDVGLPIVVAELEEEVPGPSGAISIAQALHHAIWRRFPPGAIGYVNALLGKLAAAHLEGRKYVSRELHDRIGQGVAAGIQRVELAFEGPDASARDSYLEDGLHILRGALNDIQDVAVSLRQTVGDKSINQAIEWFLDDLEASDLPVSFESTGEPYALQIPIAEELFAILQEGIRNARRHASGATGVLVTAHWYNERVCFKVSDDGFGFSESGTRQGAIGLLSMKERAAAVGAKLSITSERSGTTVSVEVSRSKSGVLHE